MECHYLKMTRLVHEIKNKLEEEKYIPVLVSCSPTSNPNDCTLLFVSKQCAAVTACQLLTITAPQKTTAFGNSIIPAIIGNSLTIVV